MLSWDSTSVTGVVGGRSSMRDGFPNPDNGNLFALDFVDYVQKVDFQSPTENNSDHYQPRQLENNDVINSLSGSGNDYSDNMLILTKGYQYEFEVEVQFKGISTAFAITGDNLPRGDGDGSIVPLGATMMNYTALKGMIAVGSGGPQGIGEVAPADSPFPAQSSREFGTGYYQWSNAPSSSSDFLDDTGYPASTSINDPTSLVYTRQRGQLDYQLQPCRLGQTETLKLHGFVDLRNAVFNKTCTLVVAPPADQMGHILSILGTKATIKVYT
tara:strand:- start:33 stop:845 length:813 start_codon:yes stop_codon:yes gene_type:complete